MDKGSSDNGSSCSEAVGVWGRRKTSKLKSGHHLYNPPYRHIQRFEPICRKPDNFVRMRCPQNQNHAATMAPTVHGRYKPRPEQGFWRMLGLIKAP